ncbi:MAG: DUF2752 domain-containing protein [Bacteroidaceae bacterium]
MSKSRLYFFLVTTITAGLTLLELTEAGYTFVICPFRLIFGIPCPACGSTRALIAIQNGSFLDALRINPLSYLLLTGAIIALLVLLLDVLFQKRYTWQLYLLFDKSMRRPIFFIPSLLLLAALWLYQLEVIDFGFSDF